MNYLDLFSGIGGFHLGLVQAGAKIDKCYFSEIDKYATQIYKRHFPDSVELGNIKGVKGSELGIIDLITFGFPCQDLSVAGKRAGLEGSRSGLFFEATRIIRECKPSVFVFENVAGLLTSNDGKDFEVVLREIADIGLYECEWQLLNTSWFLPQNRERVYFIGHLANGSGRKVFPIGETTEVAYDRQGFQGDEAVGGGEILARQ
jgi:DNA (cytosine-5)-methyltransferase 1